jgi:hypothetical protein
MHPPVQARHPMPHHGLAVHAVHAVRGGARHARLLHAMPQGRRRPCAAVQGDTGVACSRLADVWEMRVGVLPAEVEEGGGSHWSAGPRAAEASAAGRTTTSPTGCVWEEVAARGEATPRSNHAAAVASGHLVVFGGWDWTGGWVGPRSLAALRPRPLTCVGPVHGSVSSASAGTRQDLPDPPLPPPQPRPVPPAPLQAPAASPTPSPSTCAPSPGAPWTPRAPAPAPAASLPSRPPSTAAGSTSSGGGTASGALLTYTRWSCCRLRRRRPSRRGRAEGAATGRARARA